MDADRLAVLMRRIAADMREVNDIIDKADPDEWQDIRAIILEMAGVNAQLLLKLAGVNVN